MNDTEEKKNPVQSNIPFFRIKAARLFSTSKM